MSPHLGAQLAGAQIDPARLLAAARRASERADVLVVEGVGGLLVPLTLGYLVRDFARDLGLPVVIAADPGLGTINHTLLTIEAARAVGLEVALVVLTPWPADPSTVERIQPRSDRAARRSSRPSRCPSSISGLPSAGRLCESSPPPASAWRARWLMISVRELGVEQGVHLAPFGSLAN